MNLWKFQDSYGFFFILYNWMNKWIYINVFTSHQLIIIGSVEKHEAQVEIWASSFCTKVNESKPYFHIC